MRKPLDRPNILLINADDLGYGDLACYGSPLNRTPALDRLAREGMLLEDFYMAAPVCSPSRAAMLTGCYPRRIGMDAYGTDKRLVLFPGDPEGLHPDEVTIASILRRQGYATMLVGKWHVGDQEPFLPTRHGFDEFFGLPYSNDMGMMIQWPKYPPLPLMEGNAVVQEQPDQAGLTERYVARSLRFIRAHRGEPFFLYLAHMYVHVPLFVPEHFLASARNGPYGAAVECMDWAAAAILHEVARLGLEENTLVLFTSDNGSSARDGGTNAPLRGRKGTTWEGGLRVPCLARWPGVVPAGARSRELVTAMDFLPTLARLAGSAAPDDRVIDGHDILPILRGERGARSPYEAFYYYRADQLQAVRRAQWKLHLATGELYDLERDVGESANVAAAHADVVRDLERLADACRRDLGDGSTGAAGERRRPAGCVAQPRTLTQYDPGHPYIVAMYDSGGRVRRREEMVAAPPADWKFPTIGPQAPSGRASRS
jgi:arylsulfatase A-like enzyme